MPLHARAIKAALVITMAASIAACTKPEEPAPPPAPAAKAEAPLSAADCDKLADPAPADNSPTARATAVSQGLANRAACKKAASAPGGQSNEDLARIRQLMEKQDAERRSQHISDEEWARRVEEAGKAPVKQYKH